MDTNLATHHDCYRFLKLDSRNAMMFEMCIFLNVFFFRIFCFSCSEVWRTEKCFFSNVFSEMLHACVQIRAALFPETLERTITFQ